MDLEEVEPALCDPSNVARFWRNVDKSSGPKCCWPWLTNSAWPHGEGSPGGFGVRWNGERRTLNAPRVSWMLTHGPIPNGLWVLHDPVVCNWARCVNPRHLRLGTCKDNANDAKIARALRGSGGSVWQHLEFVVALPTSRG